MYIAKSYDLALEAPGCEPGSEVWNATARFEDDISAVFPYLNAEWEGAVYSPAAKQIVWRLDDHAVALKRSEITINGIPDRDSATLKMETIVAEVNRIWMDRDNITPKHETRKRLVAMEIYQLLPKTNCRECGVATCFAFASQLTVGQVQIEDCTPLMSDDQYVEQRAELREMLANAAA